MSSPARKTNGNGNGNGSLFAVPLSAMTLYDELERELRGLHRVHHPALLRHGAKKARLLASILEELARMRALEVAR